MAFIGINTKDTVFENVETNVDIPLDDKTAFQMYPKYNWVYSTSRLFDMQRVQWAPFPTSELVEEHEEFPFSSIGNPIPLNAGTGVIYTKPLAGDKITTDVAVLKGDVKWATHFNEDKELLDQLRGDVELIISALTTLHFKKFAGIISVDSIGTKIVAVRLRMTTEMVEQYPEDWIKRVLRIYNRRPWGK